MYEALEKYSIGGLQYVNRGIKSNCAKVQVFPQIINGILLPERNKYHSLNFKAIVKKLDRTGGNILICVLHSKSK